MGRTMGAVKGGAAKDSTVFATSAAGRVVSLPGGTGEIPTGGDFPRSLKGCFRAQRD